ncbi:hypothetical protein HYV64_04635 [Candidatus Shapirobacteria bacterium]|nr:hypothetical protein [Candidatus Shapirobacteria bacterium]
MDPNANPTIDPKLKEAYDRVMSTSVPPPAPASPPTPLTPPPPQPTPPPAGPVVPTPPQSPTPIQSEPTTTVHATIPITAAKPTGSAVIVGATSKQHAKSDSLFPLLFTIGGLVFFAVYTVFWIKFFNLSVPFLPF